jgi:hypothetical protein
MRFVHQFAKFENWDDENRRVKTFANGDKGSGKRVPSKHNVSNAPEPTPDAPTPSAPTSGFNPGGPMPDILPGSGNNDVPF